MPDGKTIPLKLITLFKLLRNIIIYNGYIFYQHEVIYGYFKTVLMINLSFVFLAI